MRDDAGEVPVQVVVMGVSGTGKSAVATRVATARSLRMVEGDEHHPQANIDKMAAGTPLTDEDRLPWLHELADMLDASAAEGRTTVLTCSALKQSYRDLLRGRLGPDGVFFVHLHADFAVLQERMTTRSGHFMPATLLRSQLDTLEHLGPDERGAVVDVSPPLEDVVADVLRRLEPVLGPAGAG